MSGGENPRFEMKNQVQAAAVKQIGVMMKEKLFPNFGMRTRPVAKAAAVPEVS